MNDPINIVGVPGHAGPHPKEYHQGVFDRLSDAVAGKKPGSAAYKAAFEKEMGTLRKDVVDPNHPLNKLLCK